MLDVSVVVPFFNPAAARRLHCLACWSDAPHDRYEIMLVDDGSTDGSDVRASATPRRTRISSPGADPGVGWPGRPRNVGVDTAEGRYIQFVDSDDALAPGRSSDCSTLPDS